MACPDPLFANRMRLLSVQHQFTADELKHYNSKIRASAAIGGFQYTVRFASPLQRQPVFDLFESHAFHCHSKAADTIEVCWDFRCKRKTHVDHMLLPDFVCGEDMERIALEYIESQHAAETAEMERQIEMHACLGRVFIKLDQPVSEALGITLRNRGVHLSNDKTVVCWRWNCLGGTSCGSTVQQSKLEPAPVLWLQGQPDSASYRSLTAVLHALVRWSPTRSIPTPDRVTITDESAAVEWPSLRLDVSSGRVTLMRTSGVGHTFPVGDCSVNLPPIFWKWIDTRN